MMSRIDSFDSRLGILEAQSGIVTLSDGTKFIPSSGLKLMRLALKFKRDTGIDPRLVDFEERDRKELRCFAKWQPGPDRGQLAAMVADLAHGVVERSA
jgi:hypothetical protein